jgi:hypothetical protein
MPGGGARYLPVVFVVFLLSLKSDAAKNIATIAFV